MGDGSCEGGIRQLVTGEYRLQIRERAYAI